MPKKRVKRPHMVKIVCSSCGAVAGESYGAKGFMRHGDGCTEIKASNSTGPATFRRQRLGGELVAHGCHPTEWKPMELQ